MIIMIYWFLNADVSSETESAKGEETPKDEIDDAAVEEGEILNNNTKNSSSMKNTVTARMTSLFSAVKKSVGGRKEKYSEAGESEVKTPVSID